MQMFQLAPVGFSLNPQKKIDRAAHAEIENVIIVAVQDITENEIRQRIVYNLKHPDTKALLKGLDAFFSHGLLRGDRCYWCYIEEFIPISEQEQLQRHWGCRRSRALSIAWLKDSLNKNTLHFQMLAFANAENRRIRAKWYHKNACLRNRKVLENVCMIIKRLDDVQFHIETPFVFQPEDVPIALPAPADDITKKTLSPSISHANTLDVSTIHGSHHMSSLDCANAHIRGSYSNLTSFPEAISSNSHLSALTEKLPEIETNLVEGFAEYSYTSNIRDQNYVIDEMLESHRKRIHGYFRQSEASTSQQPDDKQTLVSDACYSLKNEDSDNNTTSEKDCKENSSEEYNDTSHFNNHTDKTHSLSNEDDIVDNSQNLLLGSSPKSSEGVDADYSLSNDENELSDVCDNDEMITGVIPVDCAEIIQLATEIFRVDGERFQDFFQVYLGHSAGQPVLRYMAVTDKFVYFLSTATPSHSSSQNAFHSGSVESRGQNSNSQSITFDENYYVAKYIVHTTIAISDIAFITVGIDAQVFCIHLKKHKYFPVQKSPVRRDSKTCVGSMNHDFLQKRSLMPIDSGCKELTKFIARTLRQTYTMNLRSMNETSGDFDLNTEKSSTIPVFTKSTQLSLVVNRFLMQELKSDGIEVIHHSLIYWVEVTQEPDDAKIQSKSVEGYLDVRQVYPKAWVKRTEDWKNRYFVFMGCMLYQFTNSSCKFAERAYNVREKITQVYEADLKNENCVFQLELDEDGENGSDGGALQLKCPAKAEMNKWMYTINIALSTVNEQSIPIACQLFLTNDHAVFAQEGANCAVDGFMRSLGTVSKEQVMAVFVVRTEFHNVLVIERTDDASGAFEYLLLRDERELQRLIATFKKWGIVVEANEDKSTRPNTFNRIYRYCVRLSVHGNLWLCNRNQ